MQKITFEDTQVTKKPYVTINETEYEVQDGTYTGGTDLNATTFNNMQDNIESAINENANNIGDLTDLTTTNKTSTVEAINENNNHIGDLSSLATTNKTSTTEAINETYNKINKVNTAKDDNVDDAILIAEVTFTGAYQRQALVFATTLVGYNDTNLKVYLKKTTQYRDLKTTLLGKSGLISWKLN